MKLTPSQLTRISQLSEQWSFLWDKRRRIWIAAEDSPDGDQLEEPDLDILLSACEEHWRNTVRNKPREGTVIGPTGDRREHGPWTSEAGIGMTFLNGARR